MSAYGHFHGIAAWRTRIINQHAAWDPLDMPGWAVIPELSELFPPALDADHDWNLSDAPPGWVGTTGQPHREHDWFPRRKPRPPAATELKRENGCAVSIHFRDLSQPPAGPLS